MTNLDSILKSRDITLPTEVRLVKAMVFPLSSFKGPSSQSYGFSMVVMYGYETWAIKNLSAEELMLLNCDVGEDS